MSTALWALVCWFCACAGFVLGAWWAGIDRYEGELESLDRTRPSGAWTGTGPRETPR